jgi:microcystin degradation protein MlrC
MPAGITVRRAYEELRAELLTKLEAAMPVDAVLLPLHGAMVADGVDAGSIVDDAEGDVIARVRALVGPDVTIGVHIADLLSTLSVQGGLGRPCVGSPHRALR